MQAKREQDRAELEITTAVTTSSQVRVSVEGVLMGTLLQHWLDVIDLGLLWIEWMDLV